MGTATLLLLLTFVLMMEIVSSHWFGRYGYPYPPPVVVGGFGGFGGYGGYGRGFGGYGGFYRNVLFGPPPPPPLFYR
ncbi:unnamed protein product, partial [Brenthis ino]